MSDENLSFYRKTALSPLVLVVEPHEDTRLMMRYLLQMWKYSVVETENAEEALELTKTQRPDAILFCDQAQPESYLTIIKQMRELLPFGKTRIVFISTFSEPAAHTSALAAGADNFLVKPINFGNLEKLLQAISGENPNLEEFFRKQN